MNRRLIFSLVIVTILLVAAPSVARAGATLGPARQDVLEPPQFPRPIYEPLTGTIPVAEFQLVGFTQQSLNGIQGVLNYTLACQREFPDSRMCTADEIRHTVRVPLAPGRGYAWIEEFPRLDEVANCRGWASSSNGDAGTAIDLAARYGMRVSRGCDEPLRIACCAMVPAVCASAPSAEVR